MITRVTITGADDSVNPQDLAHISSEFPFVEWGILVSRTQFGKPRYPSLDWISKLYNLKMDILKLPLSMHLCGSYVRDLVQGEPIPDIVGWISFFERMQLNFHAIPHTHTEGMLQNLANCGLFREYIFQYDGVNDGIARIAQKAGITTSVLFDKSGGAGILPDEWPALIDDMKCGYAGGLGPVNLKEQIELIEAKAGDAEIWIDMETHVRSSDDTFLDLGKVVECLAIAHPYMKMK